MIPAGGKKSEGKRATTYDTALDEIMDKKQTPRRTGNSKDEWIEAKLREAEIEAMRKDYLEQQEEQMQQEEEKHSKKKKKTSTGYDDGEMEVDEARGRDDADGHGDGVEEDDDNDDDDDEEGEDEEEDGGEVEAEENADASQVVDTPGSVVDLGSKFAEAVKKRHEEMNMRGQKREEGSEGRSGQTSERKETLQQERGETPGSVRGSTDWGVQRQEGELTGTSTANIPGSWEDQLDQMRRRKVFSDDELGGMMVSIICNRLFSSVPLPPTTTIPF